MSGQRDKNPPREWEDKISNGGPQAGDENGEMKPSYTVNDRRYWADERDAEKEITPEESLVKPPAYVEALEEELRKKDETLKQYIAQYKSAKSEMNVAIGRIEKEKAREVNFRIAELARAFLTILDDLAAATDAARKGDASVAQGLELILQRIKTTLGNIGIIEIECINKPHNPAIHDAVAVEPVSEPEKDGIIIEVLKKGYMLGDVLVRPSSVVVGKLTQVEAGQEMES